MGNSLGVTTGPNQIIKSTKSKFATPLMWENWQRVRSGSLALENNTNIDQKTRHQQTQKPKKQKAKKKTQKTRLHTPKGGSSGRELGLVILFVLVFFIFCFFGFVLFWFLVFILFFVLLAIAKKTTTN